MTNEEFSQIVCDWIAKAKHPITGRLYTEMVYRPMLELVAYLRAKGFKTYIVSGAASSSCGLDRAGLRHTARKCRRQQRQGEIRIARRQARAHASAEINFINDGPGKPVGINEHIGRRPIAAFATPTATCKCCNGRWAATASASR